MPKLSKYLAFAALLVLAPAQPATAAARKHRTTSVASSHSRKSKSRHAVAAKKPIGPRSIDDERATQIQSALIKAGYLSGEPSGHWDPQSQAAMVRLQGDNGWQTKLVPDSRALIKLGLGPGDTAAASTGTPAAIAPGAASSGRPASQP